MRYSLNLEKFERVKHVNILKCFALFENGQSMEITWRRLRTDGEAEGVLGESV